MKFLIFFLILLIIKRNLLTNLNNSNRTDSIFNIFKETNGYIFSQMRAMKKHFHPEIQKHFEKSIKKYEYLYLTNKEDFVDFILDKFQELKYLEDNGHMQNTELEMKKEIFDFLGNFVKFYYSLNSFEKKEVDYIIEEHDTFSKDVIKFGINNPILFEEEIFSNLETLIESLPLFLLNQKKSNAGYKPKSKLNSDFKNFLINLNDEYKIDAVHNLTSYGEKNRHIDNILKNLKPKHKEGFSSFIEEFISESIINNEDFKQYYTLSKVNDINLDPFKQHKDLEKSRHFNLIKPIKNGPFRFKNINNPNPSNMTNLPKIKKPKIDQNKINEALNKNPGLRNQVEGIVQKIIAGNDRKRKEEAERDKSEISDDCSKNEEQLQNEINKQLGKLDENKASANEDLKEIPQEMIDKAGDPKASKKFASNLLIEFLKKLVILLVKHIPFYFFKFCIPPGPLVFGCCPEAAFFPQQLYNVFTAFEKVDKFKTVAKGYPDWLSGIGKENPSEIYYYICAQSYLTVHESALFNICNPTSIPITFMTLMGQIPGDLPLCFFGCLQVYFKIIYRL
jgi:hypothetical protein